MGTFYQELSSCTCNSVCGEIREYFNQISDQKGIDRVFSILDVPVHRDQISGFQVLLEISFLKTFHESGKRDRQACV